jgi:hypothetical protein
MKDTTIVSVSTAGVASAFALSSWLKEQGLIWGKDYDYDWYIDTTIFRFYNEASEYASLFSLRWTNNNEI